MLTYFIQRWTVETTFEEARAHLGMETQRSWNDQAIARTTPVVLALFAIVATPSGYPPQKKQPVAPDKRRGIAKQTPRFPMHSRGCENISGTIFQRQRHT